MTVQSAPTVPTETKDEVPGAYVGTSAGAGATVGPVTLGVKGQAGAVVTRRADGRPSLTPTSQISPDIGVTAKASAGLKAIVYFNPIDIRVLW